MESLIKEGALRLLTTESTCDVIISCQGHRLMAHKLILSMASPVFRVLFMDDSPDPAVVIFPDISATSMSLLLDYIYTGRVVVYSNVIQEFLSVACILKIHLDLDEDDLHPSKMKLFHKSENKYDACYFDNIKLFKAEDDLLKTKELMETKKEELDGPGLVQNANQYQTCNGNLVHDLKVNTDKSCYGIIDGSIHDELPNQRLGTCGNSTDFIGNSQKHTDASDIFSRKARKKLPDLLPISSLTNIDNARTTKKLCRYMLPSPWFPRTQAVFGDPRKDGTENIDQPFSPPYVTSKSIENDSNNNIQPQAYLPQRIPSTNKHEDHIPSIPNDIQKIQSFYKPTNCTVIKNNEDNNSTITSTQTVCTKPRATVEKFDCTTNLVETMPKEEVLSSNENTTDSNVVNSCDEPCNKNSIEASKFDKQKPYKCEDCGKCFSQLRNYKYHRSVHEGTKEFAAKCTECGKTFNDRGYLSSHMKIHRDKKEYACPHCPKRFNQRVAYNMHLRIHTGVKPHECTICGKSFSRKMLLKQHLRVHTGERPYSCPECGKTFADRSNMSLHARLHTGVKPYSCNLCPKSFTKKHHLKTHMNFHTGLKPYTCDGCGLAFSQSSNMRTHRKKCTLKRANSGSD